MTQVDPYTLSIVAGKPGAGKTHYAKELATKLSATLIDIDTCTERLVKHSLHLSGNNPDDRDSVFFKTHFREVIYEQLFDIAKDNLPSTSVVIAAPFSKELESAHWADTLNKIFQVPVKVFYIWCDEDTRLKRIKTRANARDKAKLSAWSQHQSYYQQSAKPACPHVFVDTSGT